MDPRNPLLSTSGSNWDDWSDMMKADDRIDVILNSAMLIAYIVPSIYILSKYHAYMDHFTRWMIIIYNLGFLGISLAMLMVCSEIDILGL